MVQISVIGTGSVGFAIGRALAAKKHTIIYATRDPTSSKLGDILNQTPNATALVPKEAIVKSDIVILATPWNATEETVKSLAESLKGKVLVDLTNPIGPN